ncbi:MAG: hypothetical protein ACYTE0_14120 [Planctomycetota bacterium]
MQVWPRRRLCGRMGCPEWIGGNLQGIAFGAGIDCHRGNYRSNGSAGNADGDRVCPACGI